MEKIKYCRDVQDICHYKCCDQLENSTYYIMMYPGEFKKTNLPKEHIEIVGRIDDILLGKCKCNNEEKKQCDGVKRFKPLDCWTYPFFPCIRNGKLELLIDNTRCPLAERFSMNQYYDEVLKEWEKVIQIPDFIESLKKIDIKYYKEYI